MGKIRCLAIISISVLMVLTFSGMAGAIGFTYTDTTSKASGEGGITYALDTDAGTLKVGGDYVKGWSLGSVEFKVKGFKLDFDVKNVTKIDDTLVFNFTVLDQIPEEEEWKIKAEYYGPDSCDKLNEKFNVSVPEPGTLLLLGSGLLGIAAYGFARSRKQR